MKARENPFQTDRIHSLPYHFLQSTREEFLTRLASLHYRAAIVGPEGSGKSTLLKETATHLTGLGFRIRSLQWIRNELPPSRTVIREFLHALDPSDILLVDGGDLVPWPLWLSIRYHARKAAGLLITSHRQGRLTTAILCKTSASLFQKLVRDLQTGNSLPDEQLISIFHKHDGNIRHAFRELYDLQ